MKGICIYTAAALMGITSFTACGNSVDNRTPAPTDNRPANTPDDPVNTNHTRTDTMLNGSPDSTHNTTGSSMQPDHPDNGTPLIQQTRT